MNAVLLQDALDAPFQMADLSRITDFYVWDVEDLQQSVNTASAYSGDANARPVGNSEISGWVRALLHHVREKHKNAIDFRVEFEHEGELYLFRGHRDVTVDKPILCLRRHPTIAPTLEDLNLPPLWRELLLRPELLKGGVIVIAAETGQGKSTTIAGTVKSRLEKFAGFCRCIEDPPELPLHGRHGRGMCIQTPVLESDGAQGFARALRSALRSYPALPTGGTICVVGEVRDGETAADLLRAGVNGHLVITTVHAKDIVSATSRLAAMAEVTMGGTVARDLLASGLVYAIHQNLTFDPREKGWRRGKIGGSILTSVAGNSGVANLIREGKFASLAEPISQQSNQMRNSRTVDEFIQKVDPLANARK